MNTYNCLIIDDEITAREILESHVAKINAFQLCGSCKNALEAFHLINTQNIKIIFTTAYREYAIAGFDLQAVDYLLKPISFERFLQAVNKYLDENIQIEVTPITENLSYETDFIFVKSDRKMVKINFEDILYIESVSDYLKIVTTQKNCITRETISNIEAKLPQHKFLRIHRSFLVSVTKIDSFTNEYVEVHQKALPISRSYKKGVLEQLENL